MAAWRRDGGLARVSRAAWRLEQTDRKRSWALVLARAEKISIRELAAAAGSPRRERRAAPGRHRQSGLGDQAGLMDHRRGVPCRAGRAESFSCAGPLRHA